MAKLEFKSEKQVREHLGKHSKAEHMGKRHESKESPKFEKAEHRLMGKGAKFGKK